MASGGTCSGLGTGDSGECSSPLPLDISKEGERIIPATRRPDGTLRKPIRIRSGYVPPDEVKIYRPKIVLMWRKVQSDVLPLGDDQPVVVDKTKSKSAKMKEKKQHRQVHEPSSKPPAERHYFSDFPAAVSDGVGGAGKCSSAGIFNISGEGQRTITPTNRPDRSLRKPTRIPAGYLLPEKAAIYQPEAVVVRGDARQWVPQQGDYPTLAEKARSKSARKWEKMKEKRRQAAMAALDKDHNFNPEQSNVIGTEKTPVEHVVQSESFDSLLQRIRRTSLSPTLKLANAYADPVEIPEPDPSSLDLNEKNRVLKNKNPLRLAEAQLQSDEQNFKAKQMEERERIIKKLKDLREQMQAKHHKM